jgi:hypothetical protein
MNTRDRALGLNPPVTSAIHNTDRRRKRRTTLKLFHTRFEVRLPCGLTLLIKSSTLPLIRTSFKITELLRIKTSSALRGVGKVKWLPLLLREKHLRFRFRVNKLGNVLHKDFLGTRLVNDPHPRVDS